MIRVLMILGGVMGFGGTEAFLMNYYRHINRNKVQFDFVFQGDGKGAFDDEILCFGGKIYHLPYKRKCPIEFTKQLSKIIKEGKYEIVHAQMDGMNWWPLWVAKKSGAKVRISHSHNTGVQGKNIIKRVFNNISKWLIPKYATDLWACSKNAGVWLYGKSMMDKGRVVVINNAIDADFFCYNPETRMQIRNKYGISQDAFVVGHCGRLSFQKNHQLLLNAFSEVCKKIDNAKLLLVGDGELRTQIESQAKKLGIIEKVIFVGNQRCSYEFYNAMDIFVFPSWYEGLGITFLEAQVNGLFCICSDKVSQEGYISNVACLNVLDSPQKWGHMIINSKYKGRTNNLAKLVEKGFDINVESKKIMSFYESMALRNT